MTTPDADMPKHSPPASAPRILFAGWLLGQLLVGGLVLREDTRPLVNDAFEQFRAALVIRDAVSDFAGGRVGVVEAARTALVDGSPHRAPGLSMWGAAWMAVFGDSTVSARLSAFPFFALMAVSAWALGARLGGERAGFLAAVFLASFPIVFGHSRLFMSSMPGAALATASACALMFSGGFSRAGWSATLGALVGFGMLMRPDFPIIAAVPCAGIFLLERGTWGNAAGWAEVPEAPRARTSRTGVVIFAVVALVVAGPWYAARFMGAFREYAAHGTFSRAFEGHTPWSLAGVLFYPREIYRSYMWHPLAGILLVSLALTFRQIGHSRLIFLALWVAVPMAVHVLFVASQVRRHLIGVTPALAILPALSLIKLAERHRLGRVVFWGAPAWCVAQFLLLSSLPAMASRFRPLEENQGPRAELVINNGLFQPRRDRWGARALARLLKEAPDSRVLLVDVRPELSYGLERARLADPRLAKEVVDLRRLPLHRMGAALDGVRRDPGRFDFIVVGRYTRDFIPGLTAAPLEEELERVALLGRKTHTVVMTLSCAGDAYAVYAGVSAARRMQRARR